MENEERPKPAEGPPNEQQRKKYVGVVFFHGIGEQRNYETTAQLVDTIDEWINARNRERNADYPEGHLRTAAKRELVKGDDGRSLAFLQADYAEKRVRFFEGYWAAATVEGVVGRKPFLWLLKQFPRPISVLLSPWRSFARLRRAVLIGMIAQGWQRLPEQKAKERAGDGVQLINTYKEFGKRRGPGAERFNGFIKYLGKEYEGNDRLPRLVALAKAWRGQHRKQEWWTFATLALLAFSMIAGTALIIFGIMLLLGKITALPWLAGILPEEYQSGGVVQAFAILTMLFTAFGISKTFSDYVGDIQQFVSYEENEALHVRRDKILAMAERTLRHVLNDEHCERVVIVGHSLGTAVAMDTILRMRGFNQASEPHTDKHLMTEPLPLSKIQHLITFGSPIDKIYYFFAAKRSASRTYERMIEDLRGDIGNVPFSRTGRQPYLHWVNFWDAGDPVSGSLEAVAGEVVRDQRVDNVEVASYIWPDPGGAHAGYFQHDTVIGTITEAAFQNKYAFVEPPRDEAKRPLWPWIGPGKGSATQKGLSLLFPAIGLLLVGTAITIPWPAAFHALLWALGITIGAVLIGMVIQSRFGLHQARIRADRSKVKDVQGEQKPPPPGPVAPQ